MARYFPATLILEDQVCLVVGGGSVAYRKVRSLKSAGARVVVVSPAFCKELAEEKGVSLVEREFEEQDVEGAFLVVGATADPTVNDRVAKCARERGILVNIVDQPDLCDFFVPASVVRGDFSVSVSTGGASPALARRVRQSLERQFGPEYEGYMELLRRMRQRVIASVDDPERRKQLFRRLTEPEFLALLREEGVGKAEEQMENMIRGKG